MSYLHDITAGWIVPSGFWAILTGSRAGRAVEGHPVLLSSTLVPSSSTGTALEPGLGSAGVTLMSGSGGKRFSQPHVANTVKNTPLNSLPDL